MSASFLSPRHRRPGAACLALALLALALLALPCVAPRPLAAQRPSSADWRTIAETSLQAAVTPALVPVPDSLLVLDTVGTLRNIRQMAANVTVRFGGTFAAGRSMRQGRLEDLLVCPAFSIDARCRFTHDGTMVWIGVPLEVSASQVRLVVYAASPVAFDQPDGKGIKGIASVVRVTRDAAGRWTQAVVERTIVD